MNDKLAALKNGALAATVRLDLTDCELDTFPQEIFTLADTLEVLDLSRNALTALPDDLGRLHRLRVIFCSDNPFTQLPPSLGDCAALEMVGFKANRIADVPASSLPPQLRWLILTDNAIESLPDAIGNCARLQKLMLAGNRLADLPASMARCDRLELLRLSANRFEQLPDWLTTLPRLAWLAVGGNPLTDAAEAAALQSTALPQIDWHRLSPLGVLGEGASGVIHEARWADRPETPLVAVKLFKGVVTSDGWPASEMTACIAAGGHRNLIPVLGRIVAHPSSTQGLVLDRIPAGWRNLAGPPSLASCTRDVYASDWQLPVGHALRIAAGIASAMAQLHSRGITHGDLYAHNILVDGEGGALLGDFGAASFVPPPIASALQRIEVRAFGCLVEELVAHCADAVDEGERVAVRRLNDLKERCLQVDPSQRPSSDDIAGTLYAL